MEDQIGPAIDSTSRNIVLILVFIVLVFIVGMVGTLYTANVRNASLRSSESQPIERRMHIVETFHDRRIGDISIMKIDNNEYVFVDGKLTPLR